MKNNSTSAWTYMSQKAKASGAHWMTVFTPAYQRESTMKRLYRTLLSLQLPDSQTGVIDFEWVVVNDGSTDNTDALVKGWCEENKLPIKYYYQKNQGKHVAVNYAVAHCAGEMFLTIDSDDTLLPNAFCTFYYEWEKIPDKTHFKGLTGRCIDPETNKVIGNPLPSNPFDVNTIDMRLKYHVKGEMCGFNRTDIMKAHPFPTPDSRMRFCPENLVWYEIARAGFKERMVEVPVREYYHDTANAITGKQYNRAISNYYGWVYGVNHLLSYIFYSPKEIIKNFVGMSRDGFLTDRSICTILSDAHSFIAKCLVLVFIPIGFLLTKLK